MTKHFTEMTTKRPDLRATGDEAKTLPEDVIDKVLSVELFDDRHVAIPTRLNKEIINILSQYDISFYDLSEDTVVFCSDRKTLKDVALFCTVADEAVIGILLETQQAIRADLLQAIYNNDFNDVQKRGSVSEKGDLWMRGVKIGKARRTQERKIVSVKTDVQIYTPSPAKLMIDRVYDVMRASRLHPCIVSNAA